MLDNVHLVDVCFGFMDVSVSKLFQADITIIGEKIDVDLDVNNTLRCSIQLTSE